MQWIVQTNNLTKRYGDFAALVDCTMNVGPGEVFGLLGPNGAGKTTLIRMLMGFLRPTAGWARIAGLDCFSDSVAVHEKVAYLPGEPRLDRTMRGLDCLQFFAAVHPLGDFQLALRIADRLDLDLSRPIALCSTGMRQKVAIAATLSTRAPLVVLDEPTSNLDPTVRTTLLKMVGEIAAEGRAVLFSSHVFGEAEEICDRVQILKAGRIEHIQVMKELRRQHRIRARLTGPLIDPPAHLADALTIVRRADDRVEVQTPGDLSPLLGWLAMQPLAEVFVEPIGLKAVYERFHPPEAA